MEKLKSPQSTPLPTDRSATAAATPASGAAAPAIPPQPPVSHRRLASHIDVDLVPYTEKRARQAGPGSGGALGFARRQVRQYPLQLPLGLFALSTALGWLGGRWIKK